MARRCNQGWQPDEGCLDTDISLSPGFEPMRSFLDLDSPTDSTFSLPADDCVEQDCYAASFLRLSCSAPSISSGMTTNGMSTIDIGDAATMASCLAAGNGIGSIRGSPSLSLTSFPSSGTTLTSCASSRSSSSSQHRPVLLPDALRQISRQQPHSESFDEDMDVAQGYHHRNHRHRHQTSVRLLDRNSAEQAHMLPSKSQSRSTNRSNSPVMGGTKSWRSSSDGRSISSDGFSTTMAMTKEEFEALPLTIQRKYFSTHERLRIVRSPDYNEVDPPSQETLDKPSAALSFDDGGQQKTPKLGSGQDELANVLDRRLQARNSPLRIYAGAEKRFRKRYHSSSDNLHVQRNRQSVILDATEESILRLGKRQPQTPELENRTTVASDCRPKIAKMVSFTADNPAAAAPDLTPTAKCPDSVFESFPWLEESQELDLRLYLDDYHYNLRNHDVPAQTKRNPSFRRHLSISKLPFGSRTSSIMSRPTTKGTSAASSNVGSPHASVPGSPTQGHVRRRSRALSMITPNKQPPSDPSFFVDPAAAHYQDPNARMKLRVYLASAHKFDEAVEFGFPSIEEVQGKGAVKGHKRAPSQQERSSSQLGNLPPFTEDDKLSMYSDEASATEPESPKTPKTMEKPFSAQLAQEGPDDDVPVPKLDYAQAPAACREMTLRMTLTRPDLRADEEQIYGWQKLSNGRKAQLKDEPQSPVSFAREGHSKESIERQFATMDQEDLLDNDDGVMKRLWNRVRRS